MPLLVPIKPPTLVLPVTLPLPAIVLNTSFTVPSLVPTIPPTLLLPLAAIFPVLYPAVKLPILPVVVSFLLYPIKPPILEPFPVAVIVPLL